MSPLLGPLLEELPDVFAAEVLPLLDPTDRAVIAQVGPQWLAAVVVSGLSRAGKSTGVPLILNDFVGSVGRLAWARENGCPWDTRTGWLVSSGGDQTWARERGCPWVEGTWRGHMEVLMWAHDNGCPCWAPMSCARAPGGQLSGLCWIVCHLAARGGHLDVLRWVREQDAPWNEAFVRECAARGGHAEEVARWLDERR